MPDVRIADFDSGENNPSTSDLPNHNNLSQWDSIYASKLSHSLHAIGIRMVQVMEPFKNKLSIDAALRISQAVQRAHPPFNRKRFQSGLADALKPLELKARMLLIAGRVITELPESPKEAFPVLLDAVENGLEGFEAWPLIEVVAIRGLGHFSLSMRMLAHMTPYFTGEFAVRPFLKLRRDAALRQMLAWTRHKNEHVRRLASEGCRPNLPWAGKLPELLGNPQLTQPILDALHDDPSAYVRLSVANHLNDFSVAHPDHVKNMLQRWEKAGSSFHQPLARRALRTLVKQGDAEALRMLGVEQTAQVDVRSFQVMAAEIEWGGDVHYECELFNPAASEVQVFLDIALHFQKGNGSLARKVFRSRRFSLTAKESRKVKGKFSFRPITTRRYYPGSQGIELVVNGVPGKVFPIQLNAP